MSICGLEEEGRNRRRWLDRSAFVRSITGPALGQVAATLSRASTQSGSTPTGESEARGPSKGKIDAGGNACGHYY